MITKARLIIKTQRFVLGVLVAVWVLLSLILVLGFWNPEQFLRPVYDQPRDVREYNGVLLDFGNFWLVHSILVAVVWLTIRRRRFDVFQLLILGVLLGLLYYTLTAQWSRRDRGMIILVLRNFWVSGLVVGSVYWCTNLKPAPPDDKRSPSRVS